MDLEFFGYRSKPIPIGADMGFFGFGNDASENFHG
jgi:hypothetical protein